MIIKWPKDKKVGDIYVSPTGSKWKWNGKAWISLRDSGTTTTTTEITQVITYQTTGITYQFSHSPMDPFDNMR